MDTLTDAEKLDAVVKQTGASRETAESALKTSDGDVDIAVRIIQTYNLKSEAAGNDPGASAKAGQNGSGQAKTGEQAPLAGDILDAIKEIIKRGNASRLDIEKDGKTLLSISLVIGTIGLVLAPVAALIGIGAALITDYRIIITLDNGTVVDVNEFAVKHKTDGQ
jgi:hypothetical protein